VKPVTFDANIKLQKEIEKRNEKEIKKLEIRERK
jgi:hypothetical protein